MKVKFFSALWAVGLCIALVACSGSDDEKGPKLDASVDVACVTTQLTPWLNNSSYNLDGLDLSTIIKRESQPAVYVKQDGRWFNCGYGLMKPSGDSKSYTMSYSTKKIKKAQPYALYYSCADTKMIGDALYYKAVLQRNKGFYTGGFGEVDGESARVKSIMQGACEVVYVINTTDEPVEFKLLGYDADRLWYYHSCFIDFETNATAERVAVTKEPDCEPVTVESLKENKWSRFVSYFPPSGQKVKNARMIAEIDGVTVKSRNTISSDVEITPQNAYVFVVQWDGVNLTILSFDRFENNGIEDVIGEDL